MSSGLNRSPRAEVLVSALSRRRLNRTNLEQKNVVSWRVPNSPKPSHSSNRSYRKSSNSSELSLNYSRENIHDPSPAETESVNDSIEDLKSLSAMSDKTSELIDFQDRCWQMLYNNIDHAIDELYDLCEEEEDITRCLEAIELFNQTTRDFTKLIEKIQTQRYFDISNPSSLSWEIRKPRRPLSKDPSPSSLQLKQGRISLQNSINNINSISGISGANHMKYTGIAGSNSNYLINHNDNDNDGSSSTERAIHATVTAINRLDAQFRQFSPKLRPDAQPFVPKQSSEITTPTNSHGVKEGSVPTTTTSTVTSPTNVMTSVVNAKATYQSIITTSPMNSPSATPLATPLATTPIVSPMAGSVVFGTNHLKSNIGGNVLTNSLIDIGSNGSAFRSSSLSPKLNPQKISPRAVDSGRTGRSPLKNNNHCQNRTPTNRSILSSSTSTKVPDVSDSEADFDVQQEVALASEKVWAEAEAWVEAEAAREDEAWDQLQRSRSHSHSPPRITIDSTTPTNSNSSRSNSVSNSSSSNNNNMTGSIADSSNHSSTNSLMDSSNNSSTNSFQNSPLKSIFTNIDKALNSSETKDTSNMVDHEKLTLDDETINHSISPHPLIQEHTLVRQGLYTPPPRGSFTHMGSSLSGSNSVPAPSSGGSSRSLHVKLSSPDRKKTSPTDLKRRTEARLTAAALSRGKSVEEKKMKAVKFLTRVNEHRERNAQKLAQAEQQLEDKLKDASKRHGEHIKTVKGKASNENTKVSEVLFINSLNAEEVADQLQRRLSEAEARILAASQRRQERLANFTIERQRRNSRKSQQMSALRLLMERQQMDRWNKLQSRLEAVQQRREARLQELQRRNAALQQQNSPSTNIISDTESQIISKSIKPIPSELKLQNPSMSEQNIDSTSNMTDDIHIKATKRKNSKLSNTKLSNRKGSENNQNKKLFSSKGSTNQSGNSRNNNSNSNYGDDDNELEIFEQFARDVRKEEIKGLRKHIIGLWNNSSSSIHNGIIGNITQTSIAPNTTSSDGIPSDGVTNSTIRVSDVIQQSYQNMIAATTKRAANLAKDQHISSSSSSKTDWNMDTKSTHPEWIQKLLSIPLNYFNNNENTDETNSISVSSTATTTSSAAMATEDMTSIRSDLENQIISHQNIWCNQDTVKLSSSSSSFKLLATLINYLNKDTTTSTVLSNSIVISDSSVEAKDLRCELIEHKILILRALLGPEIGCLNSTTSLSHSMQSVYWKSNHPLQHLYNLITQSNQSNQSMQSICMLLFESGFGTILIDLAHAFTSQTYDILLSLSTIQTTISAVGSTSHVNYAVSFESEVYRSREWLMWGSLHGQDLIHLSNILSTIMSYHITHTIPFNTSSIISSDKSMQSFLKEAKATLRWYSIASGLLSKLVPLLHLLKNSVSNTNYLISGVFQTLDISYDNLVYDSLNNANKSKGKKAKGKTMKNKGDKTSNVDIMSKDLVMVNDPWKLLLSSTNGLLGAIITGISQILSSGETPPRHYRIKETISTLRTTEVMPSLLSLLTALVVEYNIHGAISLLPSSSVSTSSSRGISILGSDVIQKQSGTTLGSQYSWEKVETMIVPFSSSSGASSSSLSTTTTSSSITPVLSSSGYGTKLLTMMSSLVKTISDIVDIDSSLLQNLPMDHMTVFAMTCGSLLHNTLHVIQLHSENQSKDSNPLKGKSERSGSFTNNGSSSVGSVGDRSGSFSPIPVGISSTVGGTTPTPTKLSISIALSSIMSPGNSTPQLSGGSLSPRRAGINAMITEAETCIGRLLVMIGKASLRRSDIQQIFCSNYEFLVHRQTNHNLSSSTLPSSATSALDIKILYDSLISVNKLIQSGINGTVNSQSLGNEAKSRSLLKELCRLPGKYFNDERYKHQLLPTLIAMTLDCDAAVVALRGALTTSILTTYLNKLLRELQETQRDETSGDNASFASREENRNVITTIETVSKRLPTELWTLALQIYSTGPKPPLPSSGIE